MDELFNPFELRPEASLNRTRIGDVPAFRYLSLQALLGLARVRSTWELGERRIAVAEAFGQHLGALIATLTDGTAARPNDTPWRTAYLDHWRRVEEVWLAGGVAAALGQPLADQARRHVRRCAVELAPHAASLALIGAARSVAHDCIALDCGQSEIKRAISTVRDGQLQRLDALPNRPAPERKGMVDAVREAVLDTVRVGGGINHPTVVACLATYLTRGQAPDENSPYARLDATGLEHELAVRVGIHMRVQLMHDGTAAARGIVSHKRAAAIVLGTALGVGFVPPQDGLLRVAQEFTIGAPAND